MPSVKHLPGATKRHLFDLITNKEYRNSKPKAAYSSRGPGSPGNVTKYGWEPFLPPGTEQRAGAYNRDPGRFRLASFSDPLSNKSLKWYQMTHTPSNTYKFELLTGIPACPECHGTGDKLCPDCKGTGRITTGNFSAACTKCRNANPLKSGVVACSCGGDCVANGVAVDKDFSKW